MEKLFFEVTTQDRKKTIAIQESDDFKTKLKNFAIKHYPDNSANSLKPDENSCHQNSEKQ